MEKYMDEFKGNNNAAEQKSIILRGNTAVITEDVRARFRTMIDAASEVVVYSQAKEASERIGLLQNNNEARVATTPDDENRFIGHVAHKSTIEYGLGKRNYKHVTVDNRGYMPPEEPVTRDIYLDVKTERGNRHFWSPNDIEKAIAMFKTGMKCSDIAEKLDFPVTANGVQKKLAYEYKRINRLECGVYVPLSELHFA